MKGDNISEGQYIEVISRVGDKTCRLVAGSKFPGTYMYIAKIIILTFFPCFFPDSCTRLKTLGHF